MTAGNCNKQLHRAPQKVVCAVPVSPCHKPHKGPPARHIPAIQHVPQALQCDSTAAGCTTIITGVILHHNPEGRPQLAEAGCIISTAATNGGCKVAAVQTAVPQYLQTKVNGYQINALASTPCIGIHQ